MTDFEYYCEEYGGIELADEEEFERMAKKARLFIKHVTYTEPDFEDDDVRSCVCALAEIYAQNNTVTSIVREKIDGYEAEYEDGANEKILMHTVKLYLPPVMLYRGF
ncbi:MAG: hypothetical protein KIG65_00485 [Eubacteriales bacterium]|nr:hypothetical protein [Eubacteriales bacterium]